MNSYFFTMLVVISALPATAFGAPAKKRIGLLTESYGIVTKADLDEEERRATPIPFPPDTPGFHYWQCLKPEGYFLGCENKGEATGEKWDIGAATYWIQANGKKTEFSTRRNWIIDRVKTKGGEWSWFAR